nr:hypothetical protein CFP56_78256 [Quercus suber]
MSASSVTFSKLPFWIQVWGLSFNLINEKAGRDIEVLLNKPLRWRGPVISSEGETSRVAFKYERLVGWCFNYGWIGHDHRDCSSPVEAEEGARPYGEWLKVGIRGRPVEADGTQHHAD